MSHQKQWVKVEVLLDNGETTGVFRLYPITQWRDFLKHDIKNLRYIEHTDYYDIKS